MNENLYLFLFSLSILFAAIIGLIRYKNANTSYRPFLWYIFLSLFNELLVGFYLVNTPKTSQVADWNLFNLFECLIFLTQFYYWQLYTKHKNTFFVVAATLIIMWLAENFIYSTLYSFNYVFLISYSFVLALVSIYTINTIVVKLNRSLFKNSMFIICVGMVIYFIYTIIVFTFLLIGKDKEILREVFEIKVFVNAFVNLMYAAAVYFIPRKTQTMNFFDEDMRKFTR
jgi:hypothetical protein